MNRTVVRETVVTVGSAIVSHRDEAPATIWAALSTVDDPEYPGVSIVDLGLVEQVELRDGTAHIGLIPTFSGCPALHFIAADVEAAVTRAPAVDAVEVRWLAHPVWSTDRITDTARSAMADQYTVVLRRHDGSLRCPVCGSDQVADTALAGPTRCRSVAWCDACRNPIEVFR